MSERWQVRVFQSSDADRVATLWSTAFNASRDLPEEDPLIGPDEDVFVAEDDGHVDGCFKIHRFRLTRPPATLACGGIGAVAVAVERRQSRVGGTMLRWALRHMHEERCPLSALYAFRESYYRKLGWESVGHRLAITCPNQRLPRGASPLPLREMSSRDWSLLNDAYSRFAAGYSGMAIRDEYRWRFATRSRIYLPPTPSPRIFAAGDPVEAYAVIPVGEPTWIDQPVTESAWATPAGYESLLAIYAAVGVNKASVSWQEPQPSPFLMRHWDRDVAVALVQPLMARVVHVPAALEQLETEQAGTFSLAVHDLAVPENGGPWRVEFSADGVTAEATDSADLSIDVGHLAQALLGQPGWHDLARAGHVRVDNQRALDAAATLMPPTSVYCLERF